MSRALSVLEFGIPPALRAIPAWAVWKYETDDRGHESKPPYQANNVEQRAYASDQATWSSFEQAWGVYASFDGWFDGISFAIWEPTGIVGIDLDHVAEWPRLVDKLRALETYVERSPSGEGLRAFCYGWLPEGRRVLGHCEMYTDKRFLTVTGHHLEGTPYDVQHCGQSLLDLYDELIGYQPLARRR